MMTHVVICCILHAVDTKILICTKFNATAVKSRRSFINAHFCKVNTLQQLDSVFRSAGTRKRFHILRRICNTQSTPIAITPEIYIPYFMSWSLSNGR